ncbi:MAG: hypothetical protein QNI87_05245 [Erythrobacter sp.]|uniref:DUF6733 family protein n=1 Tax=Erythrobacter sp. TaxID=1042 RepID=UPI002626E74E|nr:DUF6733 family protein [Erythrobacter sp.]MDJ0977923.1 hypothetical protein [Erythrobacter sp.]
MKLRTYLWISAAVVTPALSVSAAAETGLSQTELAETEVHIANGVPVAAHAPEVDTLAPLTAISASSEITTNELDKAAGEDVQGYAITIPQSDAAQAALAASPQTFELASDAPTAQQVAAAAVVPVAQYSGSGAAPAKREDSYTVLLNQDSFFGFYPSFNGLIPIGDNIDFSFYGIFWTTDGFGTGLGSDLWTEFGAGVAIHTMEGNLVIKPQLGITNGALLSGGVRDDDTELPTGTGGNFADGIVPSLTMNYSDDAFEAEFYGGYYAALRNRNETGSLDFLHTWLNAGAKIGEKFSAGAHYELLSNTRAVDGDDSVVYQWLGPYVQFSTDNGFFARFTAGADIEAGNDGDFYKLTAGFSF